MVTQVLGLLVVALGVSHARGPLVIWLQTPHDDLIARSECNHREDVAKRQVMLRRLERKLIDGIESMEEWIAEFGPPKEVEFTDLVRPLGADDFVTLQNLKADDVDGLMDRILYFEVSEEAVLLVFLSRDEKPYVPAFLFWKIDDDLPKMSDVDLCDQQLEWESTRLEKVLEVAKVTEVELTPTEDVDKSLHRGQVAPRLGASSVSRSGSD